MATNDFLSKMDTGELEKLRSLMVHALLRRRKFEDAGLPGKYWMVIFDTMGLFHFKERHCPHCLKKVLNKGTENENEDVSKNDCETKAFKRLADKLKKESPRLNVCVLADILMLLYEKGRPGIRKAKNKIKNISSDLLKSFGKLLTGEDISFISAYGYVKAV